MFSRVLAGVVLLLLPVWSLAAEGADGAKTSNEDRESIALNEIELAERLSQTKPTQAADLYLHAIAIAPQLLRTEEKVAVAKFLDSIDRRDDAINLLKDVVEVPHEGYDAELALATILSSTEADPKLRKARFYIHALKLAPKKFSYDEKVLIANTLIKANLRREAKSLLQNMTNEAHDGFAAETLLAKLRVRSGENDAALQDVNEILQHDKNNVRALLIKGGELRRRKSFNQAISAYRTILASKDDFDAALGLVYCLLAVGKKQEAVKHFKHMRAQDQWQQYDLDELGRNIASSVRPLVAYGNTRFSDSDHYEGNEQAVTGKINLADWDVSISAQHRTTAGDSINANADTGVLLLSRTISEYWRILAGMGITNLSQKQNSLQGYSTIGSYNIGEFSVDTQILKGNAQFSYSRKMLTANASLIQNGVMLNSSKFVYSRLFGKRFTVKTLFRGNQYSDDNSSREFEGTALLALNKSAPLFSVGYGYRYLNFLEPSTAGYFDAQDYRANKLLLLAAYERGPFYLYAEYALGRQSYIRQQLQQYDKLNHIAIASGTTLWKHLRLEFSLEKNNADAAASDYAYGDSSIGWRLSYSL